ncbi:uroporphyrinogen decarboxylase family protein [Peredibacter starrii]|uniref:Uroporphyrinogen decarboxylase family protein n=1 Tax=Peredibacter starrii TaxID=28202 RepID=A0AAX4HLG0_9BACT|nr:uroporphyrinogen decarboxylase family protein [Peredibacter starrii]WPU64036.1 uroporphyrinogen decarboxylase family protein [Peredibacter starrii]
MDIFENRGSTLPVWFMRQAGRYHSHYQGIKKNSDFMTMCKNPELACEVTLGPIQDFGFNAAILFSDLLFPLEQLGMGLSYHSGPPTLEWHLQSKEDIQKLKLKAPGEEFYKFQGEACKLLRERLPKDVTLLGFVGAPFTLYTYAVEGSHAGNLVSAKQGLFDGRFEAFCNILMPELLKEMLMQANNGAQAVALFDTAAGELCVADYKEFIVPKITALLKEFKAKSPKTKVIYYSKHTQAGFIKALDLTNIDVIGVDWRCDLVEIQKLLPPHCFIQGNLDPAWLHLPNEIMLKKAAAYYQDLRDRGLDFKRWVAGLGHGVLIQTPEENVRTLVKLIQTQKI